MKPEILRRSEKLPLIDALLAAHRGALGVDFDAYRNHAQRMALFTLAFLDEVWEEKLSIAAAFHDLGIWTAGTWDYLAPSQALAREHLTAIGRAQWSDEIVAAIETHHKITVCAKLSSPLSEAFRRADLVDLSFGILSFGLERDFVSRVRGLYPNAGFHRRLAQLTARALVSSPWRPLPMLRL